jgi:endonuclease/exonuclease/phosphatase family metal-dependent hydrolase
MKNFSIVTWNIQGEANITGYTFPKKIRPHLEKLTADIIALQECCNPVELCGNTRVLNNYTLLASKKNNDKSRYPFAFNDNVILTKHPVVDFLDMPLPELDGKRPPVENCLRADISVYGTIVRVYNCHFPIFRVGPTVRLKLLEHIFTDSQAHNGPIVVCGDLNTTIPKPGIGRAIVRAWHQEPARDLIVEGTTITTDEPTAIYQTIKKYGFVESLKPGTVTWSPVKSKFWEPGKLKLDWCMTKGLRAEDITLSDYVSDHRAIQVTFSFI